MASATRGLADLAPDLLRERLCEPEFVERFLSSLESGVRSCDRTCMRLYAEALKLVGAQTDISVQIVNMIGAQPAVAREAIAARQQLEGLSQDDLARGAGRAVLDHCAREGIEPLAFLASLSSVEVLDVETNGNGGPHE